MMNFSARLLHLSPGEGPMAQKRHGHFTAASLLLALGSFALPGESFAQTPAVTFTEDVAPILQDNCVRCHSSGSIAPMSLRTYEEVRPWAGVIKELVVRRQMPPFHYDSDVGTLQNLKEDWRLSDEQIATLAAWADAGTPLGDPAKMPEQQQFRPYDDWALKT